MITSTSNPTVKQLIKLRNKRSREKLSKFLVDDQKALENAFVSGYEIENIFYCLENNEINDLKRYKALLTPVSKIVFSKISYGERDKGIVALLKTKVSFSDLSIEPDAVFIVLENIEKPGNLGAILRTADAFGIDCVILTGNSCDIYNHNVIRASRGTCFGLQVFSMEKTDVNKLLIKEGFKSYSLDPNAQKDFREISKEGKRALIFGSEHQGLTEFWKKQTEMLAIPMRGTGDSLNLSVAVAVATAEAIK